MLNFESLQHEDDKELVRWMKFVMGQSKKRIFPKSVRFNGYRITRRPELLTIHLLWLDENSSESEVATFSFAPPVDFSKRVLT